MARLLHGTRPHKPAGMQRVGTLARKTADASPGQPLPQIGCSEPVAHAAHCKPSENCSQQLK